jgi:hypothetical protein
MRLNIKSSPSAFFSSTLSYHKKLQQLTENMEGIQKISALGEDRPGWAGAVFLHVRRIFSVFSEK